METSASPPLSLGLPVYNGSRYLPRALEALLGQTFADFELVICDNCSSDETEAICREAASKDARVRYVRNESNIGAAPNFNKTFELSRGKYFKWVAHDDVHAPQYLARAIEALDAHPDASLAHCRVGIIDQNGERISSPRGVHGEALVDPPRKLDDPDPAVRFEELLLNTHWCFEIFGMMRREQALRTPLHGMFYGGDKVMLAYLCLLGRFHVIPDELFFRRYHAASSTGIQSAAARESWIGSGTKKLVFPRLKCFAGYAGAIRASTISARQKLACHGVLARYALQTRKWRAMLGLDKPSDLPQPQVNVQKPE